MKLAIIFMSLAVYTMAQRPSYAGTGPIGRPGLASRFRDDESSSTTVDLPNRLGEGGTTEYVPVDARGDAGLVNRLNQWPRENRPFWLLNAEHIEASRNNLQQQQQLANRNTFNSDGTIAAKPTSHRSSFLGPRE